MGGTASKEESDHLMLDVANSNVVEALNIAKNMESELQRTDGHLQSLYNRIYLSNNFIAGHQLIKKSIEYVENTTFIKNNDNSYDVENNMQLCKQIYVLLFEYFSKVENCCRIYNLLLIDITKIGFKHHKINLKAFDINKDFNVNSENIKQMLKDSLIIENEIQEILSESVPLFKFEDFQNTSSVISDNHFEKNLNDKKKTWFASFREYVVKKLASIGQFISKTFKSIGQNIVQNCTIFGEFIARKLEIFGNKDFENALIFATEVIKNNSKFSSEQLKNASKISSDIRENGLRSASVQIKNASKSASDSRENASKSGSDLIKNATIGADCLFKNAQNLDNEHKQIFISTGVEMINKAYNDCSKMIKKSYKAAEEKFKVAYNYATEVIKNTQKDSDELIKNALLSTAEVTKNAQKDADEILKNANEKASTKKNSTWELICKGALNVLNSFYPITDMCTNIFSAVKGASYFIYDYFKNWN